MTAVSFDDDVDGAELDRAVWIPHYLREWRSRAVGGDVQDPRR